jgi:tetratricopeptide (TPR) repeat protein
MPPEKNEQQTADALVKRARALIDIRRWQEALKLLRQALAISPDSAEIFCRISYVKLNIGEYEQALANADSAARNEPSNEWPHRLRCLALLKLGKKSDALRAAEEAVRLAPQLWESFYCLTHAQIANQTLSQARQSALRAREISPESHETHELLGEVEIKHKSWSEAETHFRTALSLHPTSYKALNDLGVCLLEQNREREAMEMFWQAVRVNPVGSYARINLKNLVARPIRRNETLTPETVSIALSVFAVQLSFFFIALRGLSWLEFIEAFFAVSIMAATFILFFFCLERLSSKAFKGLPPSMQNFLREQRRRGRIRAVLISVCVVSALIITGWVIYWFIDRRHSFPSSAVGWAIFAYLFASSIVSAAILFRRRRA